MAKSKTTPGEKDGFWWMKAKGSKEEEVVKVEGDQIWFIGWDIPANLSADYKLLRRIK